MTLDDLIMHYHKATSIDCQTFCLTTDELFALASEISKSLVYHRNVLYSQYFVIFVLEAHLY